MKLRRVVVTGLGALTPIGNTVSEYWEGLVGGKSGAAPITYFDTSLFFPLSTSMFFFPSSKFVPFKFCFQLQCGGVYFWGSEASAEQFYSTLLC